jgi:hypothetical protein
MPYRPALIEIEIEEYGTILLRSSLITRSISEIGNPNDWSPRELTVKLLSDMIYSPSLDIDEVRSWDDSLVEKIARTWLAEKSGEKWALPEGVPFFEAMQRGYEEYIEGFYHDIQATISKAYAPVFQSINEVIQPQLANFGLQINQSIQAIQNSINLMAESVLGNFQANLNRIVDSVRIEIPKIQVGGFFENLPDFTELAKRLESYGRAADVLNEGGYSFLLRYWTLADIGQFVGMDQVDVRVRNAAVTNKLLGMTRQNDFIEALETYFESSSVLRRRWRIIQQALIAHQSRNYILSIPTFLAQVEGIFTDALIVKGMVIRANGHLYINDGTGNPKLDKKGKPIQLHGLGQKVQNSDLQSEYILQGLAEFFVSYLVPERNEIMHGSYLSYDKAKLSLQLILNIFLLAAEFAEFESEK